VDSKLLAANGKIVYRMIYDPIQAKQWIQVEQLTKDFESLGQAEFKNV